MLPPERAALVRLLHRTDTQRLLAHVLVIGVLLTSMFVVALDHHGAERIPNHTHLTMDGAAVSPHLHGFERAHLHDHPATSADASPVALVHLDAATDSTTAFGSFGLGALVLVLGAVVMSWTGRRWSPDELLHAQLTPRPLVQPPAA